MIREEQVLAVLEALGCGGLILDEKGRVLQTNSKARRYLGSDLDLRKRGNGDGLASNAEMQVALRNALKASTKVLPQLGEFITVPRPASRPLLLRSIRFPESAEGEQPVGPSAAIVVLDMDDCPQPDEQLLREVFLLTPAQTRLARQLSRGDSLGEIAEGAGVSLGTLRVQLKALFMKTGTRRQGELVALLAHLSRLNRS